MRACIAVGDAAQITRRASLPAARVRERRESSRLPTLAAQTIR